MKHETSNSTSKKFYFILIGLLVIIIGWILYLSGPVYTNNADQAPKKYDIIVIQKPAPVFHTEPFIGIVIQIDSNSLLIKNRTESVLQDDFFQIPITPKTYRVVGRGTLYHIINFHVGFNIMAWLIAVLAFIIIHFYFVLNEK